MRVVIEGYDEAVSAALQNVAANLRWRREQIGMSFREMSQVTGLEVSGLNRIFKGNKEWYPSTLVKIGFALDCEPADFWISHADFVKLYEDREDDGPLVLRLSRDSHRSSSSSTAANRKKGSPKRTRDAGVPKNSPFCKPITGWASPDVEELGPERAA